MEIDITAETEKMRKDARKITDKSGIGFETNALFESAKSTNFIERNAIQ